MIVRNGKTYKFAKFIDKKSDEGHKYREWGDSEDINAYIYPASGEVQARQYGNEMGYYLNLLTNEDKLQEGFGLCVYGEKVDYKVVSIQRYTEHFLLELKKI